MELYQPSNINIIGNDLPPILELKYNIYYVKENFLIEPTSNISIIGNDLPPIVEFNYNHVPASPSPAKESPINVISGDNLLSITDSDETQRQNYIISLGDIELCKIGDYVDYLYFQDGKWYLHKEIDRYVFDGTENWSSFSYGINSWRLQNVITPKVIDSEILIMSNIFSGIAKNDRSQEISNSIYVDGNNLFTIRNTDFTSKTLVQNATNGNYIIYVLSASTDTEITDSALVDELNRLMSNSLYQGYNKIYLDNELCEKLSIRYLTDSILNSTYATKSELSITNENVSALVTRSTLMEDNITNLQLGINNISTEVTSVQNITTDLENSINYLNVDMSGNSIIIPTSDENKPYVSTTYQIPYTATFKGESVNPTVTTSSASVTGIDITFTTGFVNVGVQSTTAIPTATNSFVINFSYTKDGKTYLVSKTLNVALSVEGKDGKDGTSVTILGSYNTLSDLETAHPTGNAGDSYMVGTDLYVWDVSSSSWKDVGQIKGNDGISTYFYVRYSENPNGNPMTASPTSSSKYIGVCSTTSSTAPTAYTAYTWSKYSGEDGDTTYLHIKYSEDGATFVPASDDAGEGDTPSAWVGVLTDTNPVASTTFEDYTWYKFTEEIDNQLITLQNQISQNSTDIANNYTAIVEKLDDYAKAETVATLTQTVETNQTNTEYAISIIRDLEVNGVSQVRTEKGFTFDDNGMTIDATNSTTKSVTDTNGIQVIDKSGSQESELLFAGYDEDTQTSIVRTENLKVSTYFTIGTHSRFEDYRDGTGVFI